VARAYSSKRLRHLPFTPERVLKTLKAWAPKGIGPNDRSFNDQRPPGPGGPLYIPPGGIAAPDMSRDTGDALPYHEAVTRLEVLERAFRHLEIGRQQEVRIGADPIGERDRFVGAVVERDH
jgi:hypothetical protein